MRKKSLLQRRAGKFTSVRIRNTKTDKVICGRFLAETPNYFEIEDINAGTTQRYAKSSVSLAR